MFEWIDPFAEIERLKEEVQKAEDRGYHKGVMWAEAQVEYALQRPFEHSVIRQAQRLAYQLTRIAVPGFNRRKMLEGLQTYDVARRALDAWAHASLQTYRPQVRVRENGVLDFDLAASLNRPGASEVHHLAVTVPPEVQELLDIQMRAMADIQSITGMPCR